MTEQKKQSVLLENKSLLKINGVSNIITLTEKEASIIIGNEILQIKGDSLSAEKLLVDSEELILTGNIHLLEYKQKYEKKPFLKRIFK